MILELLTNGHPLPIPSLRLLNLRVILSFHTISVSLYRLDLDGDDIGFMGTNSKWGGIVTKQNSSNTGADFGFGMNNDTITKLTTLSMQLLFLLRLILRGEGSTSRKLIHLWGII